MIQYQNSIDDLISSELIEFKSLLVLSSNTTRLGIKFGEYKILNTPK